MPDSALLILKPLDNLIISKLSLLELQELEIKNGQHGLIVLLSQQEFTSEEIQLLSFLDASLLFATTDKLETPLSATPTRKNADAKINLLKMSSKWMMPYHSYLKKLMSTNRRWLKENSEAFWIIFSDTRKLKIILLSADLYLRHNLNHTK